MKRTSGKLARCGAAFLMLATYCAGQQAKDLPRVFVLRGDALLRVRTAARATKLESPAIAAIRDDAEQAMKVSTLSVTDKQSTPPSGDKHDYMSLAPYWWPDPKSANGLPYIRRDGERNPE